MTQERTMKQEIQRCPWTQKPEQKQRTMDGKFINSSKSYLVESFVLNSVDRVVSRKGKDRRPDPSYRRGKKRDLRQLSLLAQQSGRKVRDLDLNTLTQHFSNYVRVVNLLLERMFSTPERAQQLGESLSEYRGRAHTLLRRERDLCYQHNEDIRELVYERLHRNALEHAGRTLLGNHSRRALLTVAIRFLDGSHFDILKLLRRKRIPSDLIRRVRDSCKSTKNSGSGYYYTLGVLRQIRLALDRHIMETLGIKIGWRANQRKKVSSLLQKGSSDCLSVTNLVESQISVWVKKGYPFTVPQLRRYCLDFSASTENSTGQGYWFTMDDERQNEVLLHLKLPPGIDGTHHEDSPYRGKTLTLRFLNWLPRKVSDDRLKALRAQQDGDITRAEKLTFRAAKFEDMYTQLLNTIRLQHLTHRLSRLKQGKDSDAQDIIQIERKVRELREFRRSAPPRILLRGQRVVLQIPFLTSNGPVSSKVFGRRKYSAKAGADRGLRAPVVLSVEKNSSFEDLLITVSPLVEKRERIRKYAYKTTSELDRKKNNWDRKRSGQSYPTQVHRRDRHVAALWRKVCRLDREITRQVASRTVWFCEEHRVERLFFEDLRSFQAHAGSRNLSYNLSSSLWGKIIDTVRYMRESLGHSKYSVWTVNPRYTFQTCHVCGERGVRVEDETSTTERKGGEYFYCPRCREHFHADVNAARNIIHVQDSSAAPGGTKDTCPGLSTLQ
jgi:hypothetical protein